MENLAEKYMSSAEVAKILGVDTRSVGRLAQQGRLPAQKLANRWLIPRSFVEDMADTYRGRRGRPRKKRKYTRRVQQ